MSDLPDRITANWTKEKLIGGKLQEPFFLGADIFQPHLPDDAPQKYFDRFPPGGNRAAGRLPGIRFGRCAYRPCQDGAQSLAEEDQRYRAMLVLDRRAAGGFSSR
ncbi:MAG: hypothetical protein GWQ05_03985 [Verrucomicrobiaceae bacterium]|nr:hypothetical protein [Verrucomicrobiaceae bacterium]